MCGASGRAVPSFLDDLPAVPAHHGQQGGERHGLRERTDATVAHGDVRPARVESEYAFPVVAIDRAGGSRGRESGDWIRAGGQVGISLDLEGTPTGPYPPDAGLVQR